MEDFRVDRTPREVFGARGKVKPASPPEKLFELN
jgi:hypothetical protein